MSRSLLYKIISGLPDPDRSVFVAIAEAVEDGPTPVPFRVILASAQLDVPGLTGRQADNALRRLIKSGHLRVVREADAKAEQCRIWALGGVS